MKIVFFGDSITDSGRDRNDPKDLGTGYVKIAAGKLRLLYPDTPITYVNKGIGGDCTQDLLKRVQEDVVDEAPDIVVLLVGINDVWRRFSLGQEITPEQFRANYEGIVSAIKSTGAKLLIMQPFVLNVGDKQRFRPYLDKFNEIVREIAEKHAEALIPLDEVFTGVSQDINPKQFADDGVHPTHRGCRYIADLLIKELKKYIK